MSGVVTRFAPSPTGHLHIGGARTAIFSWLLARSQGGKFVLRIEDTDQARSSDEMTEAILQSMAWLGLDWDGAPIYQSKRFDVYNRYIDKLIESGQAYYCSCSPDEVEAMREQAREKGLKPKYNGRCRSLGLGPGPGRVVRFKTPLEGKTIFDDLVKGPIAIENEELDDMVIRRADGAPIYNLAVVVDDYELAVTHVLRGDDHVSNTPKQILLYKALGFPVPLFGHVPMILGPDRKKLSKRHGARSVMEYEKEGYLPEALLNYLVRLGWSHGDQEIFSKEELLASFTTSNLTNAAAAFDPDKLLWLNSHYLKAATPRRLALLLDRHLQERGHAGLDLEYLEKIVPHYQPRAKTMVEMADMCEFFVLEDEDLSYDMAAVEKFLTPETRAHLAQIRDRYALIEPFDHAGLEAATQGYLDATGLKFKVLAQPMRVALTGKTTSPGLFETMETLGRQRTLARLARALDL
jgi:glutamyl-tRNA synthetase